MRLDWRCLLEANGAGACRQAWHATDHPAARPPSLRPCGRRRVVGRLGRSRAWPRRFFPPKPTMLRRHWVPSRVASRAAAASSSSCLVSHRVPPGAW